MPRVWSTGLSGSNTNSFAFIQPDLGSTVAADSPVDTLTLTSSDNSIQITGNSLTDTIDFVAVGGGGSSNSFETIATPAGTSPVADSPTDTLNLANGAGISITGDASTDTVTIASTITQYTDELAQDAVGTILVDSSTIDFTYDDATPSITASVIAGGLDHNSLANLTTGDPHTQYVLDAGTTVDNQIVRFDGTSGRSIQGSLVTISDTGDVDGVVNLDVSSQIFVGPTPATQLQISASSMDLNQAFTISCVSDIDYFVTAGGYSVNAGTACSFSVVQPLSFIDFVAGGSSIRVRQDDTISLDSFTDITLDAGGDVLIDQGSGNFTRIGNITGTAILSVDDAAAATKRIGLNVPTPTELFEATNTAGTRASFVFRALNSSTTASLVLEDQAANQWSWTFSNANNLFCRYNATALMRVSTTGQVRIQNNASAAPQARLDVREETADSPVVRLETSTTVQTPKALFAQNRVQTTDATVTTLGTIATTSSRSYVFETVVTARRTGGSAGTVGDSAGYKIIGAFKNVAGTLNLIGALTVVFTAEDQAAWNATLVVVGTNVEVQVTGALNNTVQWHHHTWYYEN